MKTVQRTEQHIIRPVHEHYTMLREFCRKSKNLYNQANYIARQYFFKTGGFIGYCQLDKELKQEIDYPDYRNMPTAQSAQQTLRLLSANWKAFLQALAEYKKHPDKYLGQPKPPGFLDKNGCQVLILTNQNCKLADDHIRFPKIFDGFVILFMSAKRHGFRSFQQIRLVPKKNCIVAEIVYNIEIPDQKPYNHKTAAIDIGVNNLAVIANNFHVPAVLINGRPLKSINQYYNKKRAVIVSDLMRNCGQERRVSNRLLRLTQKRNAKITDYLHKASRRIVDWCVEHDVTLLIIGHNPGWKQNCKLGRTKQARKQNNQNFVSIPFNRFIDMVSYKAEEHGITVISVTESYTSGTSVIDHEPADKAHYNKTRRVNRGMFVSNSGIAINADLNAAYQIMSKVVPFQWDSGCVLHPVTILVA